MLGSNPPITERYMAEQERRRQKNEEALRFNEKRAG